MKQQQGSNTESEPCLYSQYHTPVYNSRYAIKVGNNDGDCTTHDREPAWCWRKKYDNNVNDTSMHNFVPVNKLKLQSVLSNYKHFVDNTSKFASLNSKSMC